MNDNLLPELVKYLVEQRVPFGVQPLPAYIIEGIPHVAQSKKLKGTTADELFHEVEEIITEGYKTAHFIMLFALKRYEDPDSQWTLRFSKVSTERKL